MNPMPHSSGACCGGAAFPGSSSLAPHGMGRPTPCRRMSCCCSTTPAACRRMWRLSSATTGRTPPKRAIPSRPGAPCAPCRPAAWGGIAGIMRRRATASSCRRMRTAWPIRVPAAIALRPSSTTILWRRRTWAMTQKIFASWACWRWRAMTWKPSVFMARASCARCVPASSSAWKVIRKSTGIGQMPGVSLSRHWKCMPVTTCRAPWMRASRVCSPPVIGWRKAQPGWQARRGRKRRVIACAFAACVPAWPWCLHSIHSAMCPSCSCKAPSSSDPVVKKCIATSKDASRCVSPPPALPTMHMRKVPAPRIRSATRPGCASSATGLAMDRAARTSAAPWHCRASARKC